MRLDPGLPRQNVVAQPLAPPLCLKKQFFSNSFYLGMSVHGLEVNDKRLKVEKLPLKIYVVVVV